MKITAAIRRLYDEQKDGCATVLFRGQDSSVGTVSLSRTSGGCEFPFDLLSEHDGHAPAWHGCGDPAPGKTLGDLPEYVSRVLTDIAEVVGKPPKVEVRPVGEDGVMAEKGEKYENILQAVEKAASTGGNQAVLLSW